MIFKDYGELILGDCLEVSIPPKSVNMVFADLPYGITACAWDVLIPFDKLWSMIQLACKEGSALVFTGTQPFSSLLVTSKIKWFKHEWIWDTCWRTGFLPAKYRPMACHENVLVFSKEGKCLSIYNPQKTKRRSIGKGTARGINKTQLMKNKDNKIRIYTDQHPETIISFPKTKETKHPTEKPVALLAYLIRTYSNPGDLVFDPVCGSGSTAIACIKTGRRFLCIEKDPDIYQIAKKRINQAVHQQRNSFGFQAL